jgi:rhodanese-related sulfurtransferase/molybdopterin-guanine dinucleotide biosynthesis protein A
MFAATVAAALRAAGAEEVLEIGRDLADDVPDVGPLGGIATALRLAKEDVVVVLACDLPRVEPAGILAVVDALETEPGADVALPPGEQLHAAWRRRALPAVRRAIDRGTLAVRAALDDLVVVEVTGIDAASLLNVNTPTDLVQTAAVADSAVPEIDIAELARRHAGGSVVVDVRRQDEYDSGHVPGAVLIPLDQLQARWEEVPVGDEVAVICRTGARSARAVEALNRMGRRTVNVAGGTLAWMEAGNPVVTGPDPR